MNTLRHLNTWIAYPMKHLTDLELPVIRMMKCKLFIERHLNKCRILYLNLWSDRNLYYRCPTFKQRTVLIRDSCITYSNIRCT